jgi:hypothetical protein
MNRLRQLVESVLLLLPALALGYAAWAHFADGVAVDAAIPVPVFMIQQIAMPKVAYEDAAVALERADARDGEAAVARAEAGLHGGASPDNEVALLTHGLMQEPASARGWTILAEAQEPADKKSAARALSQALVLAPRDYWLIGARAQDSARLWPELDRDTQALALEQTRMLWEVPDLRDQLRHLLTSPKGVALVAKAFAGREDELRTMNRWLALTQPPTPR